MFDSAPCSSPFLTIVVVADLEHAGLISSEEKEKLSNYSDVIRVQSSKSLEVIAKTADVFRRRGFEKECKFLLGK